VNGELASTLSVDLPWLLLGVRLGVDATGQVFLFFTAVLWVLVAVYARQYLAKDARRGHFFAFYLLTMSGNLGLILAQDALSFYLFYALMSFSAYGLIVYERDRQALRAGRIYLYLVVLGEALLFAGILEGTWNAGGLGLDRLADTEQSNRVIGLLIVGFGIKAGALPLHVWMPLAYRAAPAPASAVLGGAMINAGLLGWLRFLPLGQVAMPEWSVVLIAAGLAAAVYGVLVGVLQDEPRTVLAYSSISQMGLMTTGVGVGMAAPELWPLCLPVILIFAAHHAFAKGALFLGVSVATTTANRATERRLVLTGLLIPVLALAGLPFGSGAVAKAGLKSIVAALPVSWSDWIAASLSLVAVGTTVLMARFLYLVRTQGLRRPEAGEGPWMPWAILLVIVVAGIWLWPTGLKAGLRTLSAAGIWHAFWPVSVGVIVACVAWALARKSKIRLPFRIPAGDLLCVAARLASWIGPFWRALGNRYRQRAVVRRRAWRERRDRFIAQDADRLLERELRRWGMGGIAFLTVFMLAFLLLAIE